MLSRTWVIGAPVITVFKTSASACELNPKSRA
jgi:hypothetical protein